MRVGRVAGRAAQLPPRLVRRVPVAVLTEPAARRRHRVPVASRSGGATRRLKMLEWARREDAEHWQTHSRPISAETLRKRLHVGATTARALVTQLRAEAVLTGPATETLTEVSA